MDNKEQSALPTPEKKQLQAVTLKFQCPTRLYARIITFMKTRGLKESTLFLMSVDEYLTKQNF